MATWEQINFQNSSSPVIEQFIFLHDYIIIILTLIFVIVLYVLVIFKINDFSKIKSSDNHELEVLWTFLPGIVLILIALPSLRLLYITEEIKENRINIKTIGHQWYWSYEYSDFKTLEFDRFILPLENIKQFRLLDVDNHTTLPEKTPLQLFVSSSDVLHSWTIPNLGIKTDCAPGRLNVVNFFRTKPGIFFGQCSEICGTNHSFIPIVLDIRPIYSFKTWIQSII
jgi:cytochrome c oxidase subunit 2